MDRLELMRTFSVVVSEGSFTKAADKLGYSSQLVSKYVSRLEEELDVRLFNRTTRRMHLTESGEQSLLYVKRILESVDDMKGHLGQLQSAVKGTLQISAPVSFSTAHLARLINDFQGAQPAVKINLELNDRRVDVIEEGFDLALRIGTLQSSSLIARKLAPIRLVMCASPEYLQEYGVPNHPEELNSNHYLQYSYMNYDHADSALVDVLKQYSQSGACGLSANNGDVLADAAIAGMGYVFQPTFIVGEAIKQGKLQVILQDFELQPIGLYAVYPHRKLMSSKLTAFLNHAVNFYGDIPYWDRFE